MTDKFEEFKEAPLARCPFCGSQAEFNYEGDEGMGAIECTNRKCSVIIFDDRESAIEKWNRRTTVPQLPTTSHSPGQTKNAMAGLERMNDIFNLLPTASKALNNLSLAMERLKQQAHNQKSQP